MWAPTGTPGEIVTKLNAAVVATFADPGVQKRLADLGFTFPSPAKLCGDRRRADRRRLIWADMKEAPPRLAHGGGFGVTQRCEAVWQLRRRNVSHWKDGHQGSAGAAFERKVFTRCAIETPRPPSGETAPGALPRTAGHARPHARPRLPPPADLLLGRSLLPSQPNGRRRSLAG
jgi:hypothetical protein